MKEDLRALDSINPGRVFLPEKKENAIMKKTNAAAKTPVKQERINARTIAFIAMLGALSAVLMLFSFPLPFAPSFLRFDVSELPALFAGFFLGPVSGCAVILIKILLKIVIQGSDTAFVGEIMNVIGSSCFVLPSALIYKYNRTKKGALISLTAATVIASIVSIFLNVYIAFPMFSKMYSMPVDAIIGMGTAINPGITDMTTLMLYSVFPFNLLKHGITATLTFLVYKKCGNALRRVIAPAARKAGAAE